VDQAAPYLSPAAKQHLLEALPLIRSRGFAIAANGPNQDRSRQVASLPTDKIRDDSYWEQVARLVGELSPAEIQVFDLAQAGERGVSYIAAPVFSPEGRVAFALVLSGMPTGLGLRDLESYSERLCATAAVITSEIHGRQPVM